jgi:hypothetical protein
VLLVFFGILFFATGQRSFYVDLLRGSKGPVSAEQKNLISALVFVGSGSGDQLLQRITLCMILK